jgi:ribosomal protein S18 acetylase RimI-like enzyme
VKGISIRIAKESDLQRIAFLYEQAFGVPTKPDLMHAQFAKIKSNPDYYFIVASDTRKNDLCVGFTHLVVHHEFLDTTKPFATAWSVMVDKEYRGRGIGNMLIEHCEKIAKGKNCQFLKLTTNESRPAMIKTCEKRSWRRGICFTKDFKK